MLLSERKLYQLRAAKQELVLEFANYRRLLLETLSKQRDMVNDKEIRVAGLRRTGNHAVIGWIRAQHPEYARHFNHPPASKNPYQNAYKHHKKQELQQGAKGNFAKQSLLVISYEDQTLERIASRKFELFHDIYVGRSAARYDLLILRDPFNLLASQLKSKMACLRDQSAQEMIDLWKSYAKEYLGETNFLRHQKVCVNFNRWHQDMAYRQAIATSLDLTFTDEGREKVRGYGGGSSFDQQGMDGNATQMDVTHRWQAFDNSEAFWQLFKDAELLEYARAIFTADDLPFNRVA